MRRVSFAIGRSIPTWVEGTQVVKEHIGVSQWTNFEKLSHWESIRKMLTWDPPQGQKLHDELLIRLINLSES
ncbi:hypothetical protein GOP47_0029267 [Adiantum capillus-veneris]|nr:hypothetical protein GOP47_0029267 [Adiantum capillus-veneris]